MYSLQEAISKWWNKQAYPLICFQFLEVDFAFRYLQIEFFRFAVEGSSWAGCRGIFLLFITPRFLMLEILFFRVFECNAPGTENVTWFYHKIARSLGKLIYKIKRIPNEIRGIWHDLFGPRYELQDDEKMAVKKGLEKRYERYVKINSEDGYSHAVVVAGAALGKALDEGKTCLEAEKAFYGHGLTGAQAGFAARMVCHFHPRGDEFKWHWNARWGNPGEREGVVNPAILTITKKGE